MVNGKKWEFCRYRDRQKQRELGDRQRGIEKGIGFRCS